MSKIPIHRMDGGAPKTAHDHNHPDKVGCGVASVLIHTGPGCLSCKEKVGC